MSQQQSYFQNVDTLDEFQPAEQCGTLSKQFQPKKFKDANKVWNKHVEESEDQSYSYTPFKTRSKSQTTPKPTRDDAHCGTLRPPKTNPFVYETPSTQTTPRMPRSRPESAVNGTMTREQKLTWGRPPPAHFRSASAMSHGRAMQRLNEFSPITQPMMQMPQRYPSFNTINLGEHIEPSHPHFIQQQVLSRPPSAVPSIGGHHTMPPQMASNLAAFIPPLIDQTPSPKAVAPQLMFPSRPVNWNRVNVVCSLQVLFAIGIFGVGVARIIFGARWAVGLEILFACFALLPALVGIYSVKTTSYTGINFCCLANFFEMGMAAIPFTIGLFPLFPYVFPEMDEKWFLADAEPIVLDLFLSILVAFQGFLALVLTFQGSQLMGNVMREVDSLKLQNNMKMAFEEQQAEKIPYKYAQ